MTICTTHVWPVCLECNQDYIPIPTLQGCPWCTGKANWTPTANRTQKERPGDYDTCPQCGGMKQVYSRRCSNCRNVHMRRKALR